MTDFFNRSSQKNNRQELRNNMPKAEVILWARLKGRQLLECKFRRQYSVGDYILDFYSAEIMLGIELDGESHFQEGAAEYDQHRQEFIESFGIKVVRFLNPDIYENMDGVLEVLAGEIVQRRNTPPGPPLRKGGRKNGGLPS